VIFSAPIIDKKNARGGGLGGKITFFMRDKYSPTSPDNIVNLIIDSIRLP